MTYNLVYDTLSGNTHHAPNLLLPGDIGEVTFNPLTSKITWHTSNADVNWTGSSYLNAGQEWIFLHDSKPPTHTVAPEVGQACNYFETRVQEVKPEMDQVVYTNVTPTPGTITTPIDPTPADPAAVVHWNEDQTQLVINFHSNDEQQETTNVSVPGGILTIRLT